jgi:hypothetical protein
VIIMAKRNAYAFEETCVLDSTTMKDERFNLRVTSDGYMVCQPRIARTGIQLYRGIEVGRPDLEEVRVYRPESEVFSRDAVRTLAGKPVTIEHPDEPVTAANWRDNAVGYLGDEILRDGEFIRVPLHLMDASAIEEVKSGRSQLSVGYTSQLDWADGVTPSGEKYHVKQTAIRANHVAITHTARGGPLLRMGDKARNMTTRTIMIDGISVEASERDTQVIERRIAQLDKDLSTAQAALAAAQATAQNDVATARTETANATAIIATKDAEIATLKQQVVDAKVTPKKLNEMARARSHVEQRAKALLDSVLLEEKSDEEIRRQVVNAKLGEVAKGWTDDMIAASFNTLTVAVGDSFSPNGNLQQVVHVLSSNEIVGGDPRVKAYSDYDNDIMNRWKTAGQRNTA